MRMKSLNKKFKILNFRFIMWLNKKLQLRVSNYLEEIELIFVIKKETIVLLKVEPTIGDDVLSSYQNKV